MFLIFSSTYVCVIPQRDDIGIGGAWVEFVDYLKSSLSSGDVKLILSGHPNVDSSESNNPN